MREVGASVSIKGMSSGFRMKDIVRSLEQEFIAYQGSLTTPPCAEAVSWLVARNPMKISRNDVRIEYFFISSFFSSVFLFVTL